MAIQVSALKVKVRRKLQKVKIKSQANMKTWPKMKTLKMNPKKEKVKVTSSQINVNMNKVQIQMLLPYQPGMSQIARDPEIFHQFAPQSAETIELYQLQPSPPSQLPTVAVWAPK